MEVHASVVVTDVSVTNALRLDCEIEELDTARLKPHIKYELKSL